MTPAVLPIGAPYPKALLGWDGTAWRVFAVDSSGHLQADVLSTVMDASAAADATVQEVSDRLGAIGTPALNTANDLLQKIRDRLGALSNPDAGSTNKLLTDALTALQDIDDLQGALHSQDTDELVVRGEDQLHSYEEPLGSDRDAAISGADGYCDSHSPADGLVWHVLEVSVRDKATTTTLITITAQYGGAIFPVWSETAAVGINEYVVAPCEFWLEHNDTCRVYFTGGLVGDQCEVVLVGEVFTKET